MQCNVFIVSKYLSEGLTEKYKKITSENCDLDLFEKFKTSKFEITSIYLVSRDDKWLRDQVRETEYSWTRKNLTLALNLILKTKLCSLGILTVGIMSCLLVVLTTVVFHTWNFIHLTKHQYMNVTCAMMNDLTNAKLLCLLDADQSSSWVNMRISLNWKVISVKCLRWETSRIFNNDKLFIKKKEKGKQKIK